MSNSSLEIHFDGDIADNHQVSLRTLGKSLTHIQSAIDRAYLDVKYEGVWKYARMKSSEYSDSDFLVMDPRPGGYILDLINNNKHGKRIIDRISNALRPAFDSATREGEIEAVSYVDQVNDRNNQLHHNIKRAVDFEDLLLNPDKNVIRKFGDRAIVKEIDQVLSIIRSKNSGDSEVELTLSGSNTAVFNFNKQVSKRFRQVVSEKGVGDPVIYEGFIRSLDRVQKTGKFIIASNKRTINLHFTTEADFNAVHPYLKSKEKIRFIGAPLIEYGAFDPNSGDIYYVRPING
jgi:hypothetical protein